MTTFSSKLPSSMLTWLICAGMLAPTFSLADDAPSTAAPKFFQDVSLTENRELEGRLVNRSGAPLADVEMTLVTDRQAMTTLTDADGNFAFANLNGSACIVESGEVQQNCRVWMANTAPPAASNGLLLVADDEQVARGQNRRRRRRRLLLVGGRIGIKAATIPFMVAGAVARRRDRKAEEEAAADADLAEADAEGIDAGGDAIDTDADTGSDAVSNAGSTSEPSTDAGPADAGTDTGADIGTDPGFDDPPLVDPDFEQQFDDSDFDVDAGDSNSAS